ncbi:MAG: hypothetical protein R2834_09930 [Rhodothermales bacterium]
MFDSSAFDSWPTVLSGALVFGLLFGVVGLLSDFLFSGAWQVTRFAAGFAGSAFVGYIVVSLLIRRSGEDA